MIKGSCLCGAVSWGVSGELHELHHCHCSMCRKAHGAPFATYARALSAEFEWLSGADVITRYESSPGFIRAFCSQCGSVLPDSIEEEFTSVPIGCLDDDPGLAPSSHIFVADAAPWHVIGDGLPRHDTYPEGESLPVIERPALPEGSPEVLRGSCLCGGIAYEVHGPIKMVHNCHCSRCRKARAAAHTTNGFTAFDGVRFTRGEELLAEFKLPEARFFTHVFCRTCGSGMPRLDSDRSIAVIPFGSLDDDPGRGADDLPQFEELPG